MSKAERDQFNTKVKLSGLTKQDYVIKRCLVKEIVVIGSPRIYKALSDELANVLDRLNVITTAKDVDNELLETINLIAITLNGLKKKNPYLKR